MPPLVHDPGQHEVAEFAGDRVWPRWPGQAQRVARPGRRLLELGPTSVRLGSVGPAGPAWPPRGFADLVLTSVGSAAAGRHRSDLLCSGRICSNYPVPYYWLIDSEARTLEALRYDGGQGGWFEVGTYDDTSVARIEPFEAIELPVGRLFSPRRG